MPSDDGEMYDERIFHKIYLTRTNFLHFCVVCGSLKRGPTENFHPLNPRSPLTFFHSLVCLRMNPRQRFDSLKEFNVRFIRFHLQQHWSSSASTMVHLPDKSSQKSEEKNRKKATFFIRSSFFFAGEGSRPSQSVKSHFPTEEQRTDKSSEIPFNAFILPRSHFQLLLPFFFGYFVCRDLARGGPNYHINDNILFMIPKKKECRVRGGKKTSV